MTDKLREAIRAAFNAGCDQGSDEATAYEWGAYPQQKRDDAFADFMAEWNPDSAPLRAALAAAPQPAPAETFQNRVEPWMTACFGPEISGDRMERADRLLEEVLELLQSGDYPRERIAALTGYVWSRPKGEPAQEVGGVMVTLAAYCLAHSLDMHEAGEIELARIWTKVEKIRAKQAAKPTGSALPQAWPEQPAPETMAWAVVDENGGFDVAPPDTERESADDWPLLPGERLVRVAIRVVEGGDEAA